MKAGITGLPYSGKTTLFCALTGQDYESIAHDRDVHIGMVKVPDVRLQKLYDMFTPKKMTPATMEYFDVAGQATGQSKELDPKVMQTLKNADSLIVVLGVYSGETDPVQEYRSFMEELALTDLVVATNRLERLEKEMRSGKKDSQVREKDLLERCRDTLEAGELLDGLDFSSDEKKLLRGFQFLTQKSALCVANIDESMLSDGKISELEARVSNEIGVPCAAICAEVEMEVAAIEDSDERMEFLTSMGIDEPAVGRLIRMSYDRLGLMSFFTAGGTDEVRAWTVRKDSTAPECAGAIHSDLERGFIRAETVAYDDLMAAGSFKEAREKGTLRIEGKDYIVQDGDILTIRFSV